MIDTDKYENITPERWAVDEEDPFRVVDVQDCTIARTDFVNIEEEREWQLANAQLIADAPLLLAEVKRLREENDLLYSMQRDGIVASAHDKLLLEINRLREDNEKLHDAINRSFHAKISGSALEIYNGWWEGEEE